MPLQHMHSAAAVPDSSGSRIRESTGEPSDCASLGCRAFQPDHSAHAIIVILLLTDGYRIRRWYSIAAASMTMTLAAI